MNIDGEEELEAPVLEVVEDTAEAGDEQAAEQTEDEEAEEAGDLVVQFGEEAPEEVEETDNREAMRNMRARIKELEAQVKDKAPAEEAFRLGPKPTRAEFDYDEEAFDAATEKWYEDKRKFDDEQSEAEKAKAKATEEWNGRLERHMERKAELAKRVPDMDEAEAFVLETLSPTQQGILIEIAEDSAMLGYALAKNPTKAKELAGETNHIRFTKKLALLEASLKTSNRKAPPPNDRPLNSTSTSRGTVDGELDRLREDAEKTGDYSKVMAYKRQRAA